jgi:hypothetical protein
MQQHVSQDRTKKEERNDNNRGLVEHCDERKAGVAYVDCGRYVRELNRRSSFAQVSMCNCRNSRLEGSRGGARDMSACTDEAMLLDPERFKPTRRVPRAGGKITDNVARYTSV